MISERTEPVLITCIRFSIGLCVWPNVTDNVNERFCNWLNTKCLHYLFFDSWDAIDSNADYILLLFQGSIFEILYKVNYDVLAIAI